MPAVGQVVTSVFPLPCTDSEGELEGRSRVQLGQTENQTMEICQLLLSLIHAWGVDVEIDRLCETKLGMLRPKHPVCYGLISKHGQRRTQITPLLTKCHVKQVGSYSLTFLTLFSFCKKLSPLFHLKSNNASRVTGVNLL